VKVYVVVPGQGRGLIRVKGRFELWERGFKGTRQFGEKEGQRFRSWNIKW